MLAAAWAADIVVIDVFLHLFLGPCVYGTFNLDSLLIHIVLNQLVGAETLFTCLAVHKRIGKTAQMAGSHPCLGVHKYSTVNTHVIRAFLYEFLPPGFLYIVLQLHTEVTVIPCIGKSAVNLRTRVYKSS